MRKWISTPGLMIAVLMANAVISGATYSAMGDVSQRVEQIKETPDVQYQASWVDALGITHIVTTTQGSDETDEDFLARHVEAVNALKEEFPPA